MECDRCGRQLKDKRSIKRGLGPKCWEKEQREAEAKKEDKE